MFVLDSIEKEYLTKGWTRLKKILHHHPLVDNLDPDLSCTVSRSKTLTQQNLTQPRLLRPPLLVAHQRWSMERESNIIQNTSKFLCTYPLAGFPALLSLVYQGKPHQGCRGRTAVLLVCPQRIIHRAFVP